MTSTETVLPGPPWAEEHPVQASDPTDFTFEHVRAGRSGRDGATGRPGRLPYPEHAYAEPDEPADEPTGGDAGPADPGRAPRLPRVLLTLLCLGYLLGAGSGWGSPALADFMGDFGLAGAALTAALSCLAYGCTAGGRQRPAWFCFGVSSLMVALGNGTWGWYEVVWRTPVPTPSFADYAFLLFAPPAILGLLLLAKRPHSAAGWLCLALDGWLIAGSLLTLSWSLALARTARGDHGSPLRLSMALAYPVLDILLVSMVLGLRFRSRDGNRAAVHTAIVALALTVLCDALFTSQALKDAYHSGQLLDAGWFTGSMLLAWAPWARGHRTGRGDHGWTGSARPQRVASTFSALTPYAAAAVCTVGLLYNAFGQSRVDRFVLIVACTVVFALILRQGIMLLDNLALAQRLSHQENHFRSLVQGSSDVIMIADPAGVLRYVSPAASGVYGRRAEELIGRRLPELVHPEDLGHVLWEVQRYLAQSPADEPTARIECRIRSGAGEWLDVESTVNRYRDGLIFNCRDVSERVRLQAQLEHNAFHDTLTDLPNRALFLDRGRAALTEYRPSGGGDVAVLFLDLDGFKAVNDTAGHQVGDELLVQAARRLQDTVRSADTVARLGGDEFAVLLGGLDQKQAEDVAERLRTALSQPYWIGGEELGVAASIGIAFAEPGITPARLLRNADLAMYRAKKNGKGRVAVYGPELRSELHRRSELEQRLRAAVREGRFALLHEPVVDLDSGAVVALSAQARWRSAQGLLLTPAEFLRASEGGDRAARFSRWMVEQAVQLAVERRARLGPDCPPVPVAVRLPARRLAAPGLCESIESLLLRTGLPASGLLLEITEGDVADGRAHGSEARPFDELVTRLTALRVLGVGLALDGLGGPSAPLSGLRRLPVDQIKMERGLVDGLVESAFLRTLATSVLRLGRELGLTTVAEGVDDPMQALLLRDLGCHRGQGLCFSGPLDEPDLDAVLRGPGFPPPRSSAAGPARLVPPSGELRGDRWSELRPPRPAPPRTSSDQAVHVVPPDRGSPFGAVPQPGPPTGPHDETSFPPA